MLVRFSVVAFPSNSFKRFGVCGSVPELGSWKTALPLDPVQITADSSQPSLWVRIVSLPFEGLVNGEIKEPIEFKFVSWESDTQLLPKEAKFTFCESDDGLTELVQNCVEPVYDESSKCSEASADSFSVEVLKCFTWEGDHGSPNRVVMNCAMAAVAASKGSLLHEVNEQLNRAGDGVYSLPVLLYREPAAAESEYSHTTRYYRQIKEKASIHYNQILPRVFMGSCPRSRRQIEELKNKEKISDVVNFQTFEDLKDNYPDCEVAYEDRSMDKVYRLYESIEIRFTWLPTADMSSSSRATVLAQSVCLLAALLQRPDCTGVYVHCNAGVGRSVSAVAGFIHCCLKVPLRLTNLLINSRRPVAYFDEKALLFGSLDFRRKFAAACNLFKLYQMKTLKERKEATGGSSSVRGESLKGVGEKSSSSRTSSNTRESVESSAATSTAASAAASATAGVQQSSVLVPEKSSATGVAEASSASAKSTVAPAAPPAPATAETAALPTAVPVPSVPTATVPVSQPVQQKAAVIAATPAESGDDKKENINKDAAAASAGLTNSKPAAVAVTASASRAARPAEGQSRKKSITTTVREG